MRNAPTGVVIARSRAGYNAGYMLMNDWTVTSICRSSYKHMHYSSALQPEYHTLSGGVIETGGVLGAGRSPDRTQGSFETLPELTWNGRDPKGLAAGTRTFLEDGDSNNSTGWCEGDHGIGVGEGQ